MQRCAIQTAQRIVASNEIVLTLRNGPIPIIRGPADRVRDLSRLRQMLEAEGYRLVGPEVASPDTWSRFLDNAPLLAATPHMSIRHHGG